MFDNVVVLLSIPVMVMIVLISRPRCGRIWAMVWSERRTFLDAPCSSPGNATFSSFFSSLALKSVHAFNRPVYSFVHFQKR